VNRGRRSLIPSAQATDPAIFRGIEFLGASTAHGCDPIECYVTPLLSRPGVSVPLEVRLAPRARFLLLIPVGRRYGLRRVEVLDYRKEGPEVVVMSAFGPNADWLRNMEATPGPEVVIGSQRFTAAHRILDEQGR
jgi:deazaflavin-dependent oxidoreductase (nitroreductase family)